MNQFETYGNGPDQHAHLRHRHFRFAVLLRDRLLPQAYVYITRFDRVQEFASYARLVKCQKHSGGETLGTSGAKRGNVHLKR